jgi:hypothetical protein
VLAHIGQSRSGRTPAAPRNAPVVRSPARSALRSTFHLPEPSAAPRSAHTRRNAAVDDHGGVGQARLLDQTVEYRGISRRQPYTAVRYRHAQVWRVEKAVHRVARLGLTLIPFNRCYFIAWHFATDGGSGLTVLWSI